MHRRTLPIADPCNVFRPSPGNTFCSKCEKHVHDLSEMTERAAARFLAAHAGQRICVAYRTRPDGSIVMRPEPRPLGVLLVSLGLAACTGYAPEVQHPDESCRDAQGYEIECRDPARVDVLVVPDGDAFVPVSREARDPAMRSTPDDEGSLSMGGVGVAEQPTPPEFQPMPVPPVPAPQGFDLDERDDALVGRIDIDGSLARLDSTESRRAERAERREARRDARRERRAARD